MDREEAEKYADMIWEGCASTGSIADFIQAHFIPKPLPSKLEKLIGPDKPSWTTTVKPSGDWCNCAEGLGHVHKHPKGFKE